MLSRIVVTGALALAPHILVAQCPDGTPPPCGPGAPARSVAVLTFDNVTRDTTAEYLAEGLADQIFTRLSQLDRLTVISRGAVRRLRGAAQLSVQQLGRALNVAYLVDGSIRVAGGRLHVNVEALRAASGAAIWSNAYDRAQQDLLGLEEAIATEVATGIAGRLTPQEQRILAVRATSNTTAYARYVRGNVLLARRTPASIIGAIADHGEAVEADPSFTEAQARLAYAYAVCVNWSACGADSGLTRARQAADRAIRLDPRSSEAWLGRAYVQFQHYANIAGTPPETLSTAYAAFRRAVELDPRNDEAWHQYGATLWVVNDSAAEVYLRRALAIDPTRAVSYFDLAYLYTTTRRTTEALRAIDSAIALDPNEAFVGLRLLTRLEGGDTAGALIDARARPRVPWSPEMRAAFGHDTAAARIMEARLASRRGEAPGVLGQDYRDAVYLLWTGQRDAAIDALTAVVGRFYRAADLRSPLFDRIRGDPRIQALTGPAQRELAQVRWQ